MPPSLRHPQPATPPGPTRVAARLLSRLVLAILAAILLSASAPARGQSEPPQGAFSDQVGVEVVDIDVVVTDRKGEPISNLGLGDFEILEDGKLVEITSFLASVGTSLGAAAAPANRASALPRATPSTSAASRPDPWVILVDQRNLRPQSRSWALSNLQEILERHLPPGTPVMVASLDGGVHLAQPFTSDPELIASALETLMSQPSTSYVNDADYRNALGSMEDVLRSLTLSDSRAASQDREIAESRLDLALEQIRSYAQQLYLRSLLSVRSLSQMINALAGVPGHKSLLYISEGIPQRAGEELFVALQHRFSDGRAIASFLGPPPDSGEAPSPQLRERTISLSRFSSESQRFDLTPQLEALVALANAHRVTLHALDAGGPESGVPGADISDADAGYTSTSTLSPVRSANLQAPLRQLAQETGGLALLGGSDVDGFLGQAASSAGYLLGYSPSHSPDGKLHKIQVKVHRKDARVRHREAYLHQTSRMELSARVLSALVLGLADNPHAMHLELGAPGLDDEGHYIVPVVVQVPFDHLALRPREDLHELAFRLWVTYQKPDGSILPTREMPIVARLSTDQLAQAEGQAYSVNLQLRTDPGPHRLAVGLWEEATQTASFLSQPFTIQPPPAPSPEPDDG